MPPTYYARSENAQGQRETVVHHLQRAGELCSSFLAPVGRENWGWMLGTLHDVGKISPAFQRVLDHQQQRVNHALPGAVLAMLAYHKDRENAKLLAQVIASHHGQLGSFGQYAGFIRAAQEGEQETFDAEERLISLCGQRAYQDALQVWTAHFRRRKLETAPDSDQDEDPLLSRMLFVRMLYAALVDADWCSSAEHFEPDYLPRHTGAPLDAGDALRRVQAMRAEKQQRSNASPALNRLRDALFDACLAAGAQAPGLFTLTAPTGLGKTLALFAFAARHCAEHERMRRIVIILPYLSIIEQNAQVYRTLVPDMMEKHMNVRWTEENARLAERWDAPCIVTTAVSFFEPLFSATAGDCRHLHQLANSVIVLDEAQSLPPHLLDATLRTVKLLCRDYGCTAVFSTATQPSFRYRPGLDWQPREIVPDPAALFQATRRVTWDWRLDRPMSFDSLAEEAAAHSQCCIILNLKKHADALAAQLTECGADGVLLLTTDLCPAHRSDVLAQVRARLAAGQPCRLVATQCIEAGVDVDFPVLYRALAPLEAIIQAAGRCNRNGDGPDGRVTVFVPAAEGRLYPTASYARAADCVRILLARHPIDPGDVRHIDEYYQLLYQYGEGDAKALQQAIQAEDYPAVENAYRMIDQGGVQVIVPYAGRRALYEELRREIDETGLSADILRRARALTVSTYDVEGVKGCCQALYFRRHGQEGLAETPCYLLGNDAYYDEQRGLHFDREPELIL